MSGQPTFRFAPSPNGFLHLGHALSALTGFAMARRVGGQFLLRIEDIDVSRTRPEYVAAILEDLAWLGLTWEEPVLRQSQHFEVYRQAAERLVEAELVYPCILSRTEIGAASDPVLADPDGVPRYLGPSRRPSRREIEELQRQDVPFALRLDMAAAVAAATAKLGGGPITFTELDAELVAHAIAAKPERWGDAVIVRKDVPTSYHLAVVIDDARQGVTHVTRGMDLYAATDLHRVLQVLLELPEPVYHHHRLLTDGSGRKLAKSARDTSLRELRAQGVTAGALRAQLGFADLSGSDPRNV